jgi:hypothetical protein
MIFAVLVFFFSTAAFPECYSIYTPKNELVWQSMSPPVAMNTLSLNGEVNKKMPQGHLVITNNPAAPCRPVDLIKSRSTMRQKAEEMKYD